VRNKLAEWKDDWPRQISWIETGTLENNLKTSRDYFSKTQNKFQSKGINATAVVVVVVEKSTKNDVLNRASKERLKFDKKCFKFPPQEYLS
jgi:hypothetical protein